MAIVDKNDQLPPSPPAGAMPPVVFHPESSFDSHDNPRPSTPTSSVHNLPNIVLPTSLPLQHTSSRHGVVRLMLKHTYAWVFSGVITMLIGIVIARYTVLPKIHTCPTDATCIGSYDLVSSDVRTYLQTVMQYWLKAGMVMASMGLLKLSAYQAWFILMRDGNTIANLDYTLGAIRGSILDTLKLAVRRGNRWLSMFLLGQLGVSALISLLVGLSLSHDVATQWLTFTYPSVTLFPDSSLSQLNSAGQVLAISKINSWALGNDTTHSSAYRGSLVNPDGRNVSINAIAGGPRIFGKISCAGYSNYSYSGQDSGKGRYDIQLDNRNYTITSNMRLAVSMTKINTAKTYYLWASNTTNRLPNATQTSDGVMNIAYCTHDIGFANLTDSNPPNDAQVLNPNFPRTSGCDSPDDYVCVADAVNNAVLSWWGGVGTSMWGVNCRGSVVGPLPTSSVPEEHDCALTEELWTETVTGMLDALVQTGLRTGNATQQLLAPVSTLNTSRWWLQSFIPLLVLVLYGAGLYYTYRLSGGKDILKELTLEEVIGAAQTDHVRTLIQEGRLKETMMLYGSEKGFVIPTSNV